MKLSTLIASAVVTFAVNSGVEAGVTYSVLLSAGELSGGQIQTLSGYEGPGSTPVVLASRQRTWSIAQSNGFIYWTAPNGNTQRFLSSSWDNLGTTGFAAPPTHLIRGTFGGPNGSITTIPSVGGDNGQAVVYDASLSNPTTVYTAPSGQILWNVITLPTGRTYVRQGASSGGNTGIRFLAFDALTGANQSSLLVNVPLPSPILGMTVAPDGMIYLDAGSGIYRCSIEQGLQPSLVLSLPSSTGSRRMVFTPDNELLIAHPTGIDRYDATTFASLGAYATFPQVPYIYDLQIAPARIPTPGVVGILGIAGGLAASRRRR